MKFTLVIIFLASIPFWAFGAEVTWKLQREWVYPLRDSYNFNLDPQERTQPIVIGDILYTVGLSGKLVALHRKFGYELWTKKMPAGIDGSLSYGRSLLVLGSTLGNLWVLNSRDGSESWNFKTGSEFLSPAAIQRGRILASTSNDELFVLSENQPKELGHLSQRGDEKLTIRGGSTPVVEEDIAYQGFSDGSLVAFSIPENKVLWKRTLSTRRFRDIDMRVLIDGDFIYVATYDGQFAKLAKGTGEVKWLFPVGSYSGFVQDEERIYLAGLNQRFYAIQKSSGQPVWSTEYEGRVGTAPVMTDEFIAFGTSQGPIYVLDAKTGAVLTQDSIGAGSLANLALSEDGHLYCLSNYGNLYAYEVLKVPKHRREPEVVNLPSAIQHFAHRRSS